MNDTEIHKLFAALTKRVEALENAQPEESPLAGAMTPENIAALIAPGPGVYRIPPLPSNVKHVGGPWYEVNGARVKGKAAALAAAA